MRLCSLFFLAFLWACTNPFATRQPALPSTAGQNWLPPRRPEFVFQNLINAIRDQNLENYLRCLSDTARQGRLYTFIPDQGVASESPETFFDWHLGSERIYFSQLRALTPADSAHFLHLQEVQSTIYADSAIIVQDYTLVSRHTQQNRGVPGRVAGQARFTLGTDAFGDWAIYRWEDRANGSEPTWSVLKAIFGR